jgi:hypothetical protein
MSYKLQVKELRRCTLDFEFPQIDFLFQMIELRRNIIYRCGKDKEGKEIELAQEDLEKQAGAGL